MTTTQPGRVPGVRRTDRRLTPAEWCARTGVTILDPDGWDRANFAEDWAKPLTWAEFEHKAAMSTSDLASRRAVDDRQEGTGVAVSAAHGSDGGQGGSGDSDAPQRHAADDAALEHLERSRAIAVRQLGEALDRAERMTRQRDEAVKAFQRERARVGRVEELAERLARIHNRLHEDVEIRRHEHLRDQRDLVRRLYDGLQSALADRPTDE